MANAEGTSEGAARKRESDKTTPNGEPDAKKISLTTTSENPSVGHEAAVTNEVVLQKSLSATELRDRFPSLPLENESSSAPLMGLFFAASWCDDCEAVISAVESFASRHQGDLEFVYVASDKSEEEMKKFVPSAWSVVPFDRKEERDSLKRHFGVCAGKEREALGMTLEERKFGIPTLIILDRTSGRVLTTSGVEDITGNTSNEDSVVTNWKAVLS